MGPDNLNDLDEEDDEMAGTRKIHTYTKQASQVVPNATLELLALENNSMKEDLALKCDQILEYKYLVEEISQKLDSELSKNRLLNQAITQVKEDQSMWTHFRDGPQ